MSNSPKRLIGTVWFWCINRKCINQAYQLKAYQLKAYQPESYQAKTDQIETDQQTGAPYLAEVPVEVTDAETCQRILPLYDAHKQTGEIVYCLPPVIGTSTVYKELFESLQMSLRAFGFPVWWICECASARGYGKTG
ncbi:hypothetical protein P4S72_07570 [Vibrio sp. PP-XX7]